MTIFAHFMATGLTAVALATMSLAQPALAADRQAPPIVLGTLDGSTFNLGTLRNKRAALLVFWASW